MVVTKNTGQNQGGQEFVGTEFIIDEVEEEL